MKKIPKLFITFITVINFITIINFITPTTIQADSPEQVFGRIIPPPQISNLGCGEQGISRVLSNIILLIYMVSSVIFVFMVIFSGLQWILSGGDKEAVSGARKRLTYAIIGIVFLALAFIFLKTLGQITGFEFFGGQNLPLPVPGQPTPTPAPGIPCPGATPE